MAMTVSFSRALQLRSFHILLMTILLLVSAAQALAAPPRVSPTPEDILGGSGAAVFETPGNDARPTLTVDVVKNLNTMVGYTSLQAAITAASANDVLQFIVSSHAEGAQIVIPAPASGISILGALGGTTLTPLANTGTSGDPRGWLLVLAADVTISDITFDGTGFSIYQAVRIKADGAVVNDCTFQHIRGLPAAAYDGRGIASVNATTTVSGCTFLDIYRIGIHVFGPSSSPVIVSGNSFTGKGAGDWIDYAVELGGGAEATLSDNVISDCTGVAISDGSGSAGVLITDYFAPGTEGILENNVIGSSSAAVVLGFLPTDMSLATLTDNDLSGNAYGVVNDATPVVDASINWWGSNLPATVAAYQSGPVDYTPWFDNGTDTGGAGFEGDRSVLDVDDDSPQTGATGRIQEGVNNVTASTLNIMPGMYEEQVIVDGLDVILQGSGRLNTTIRSPLVLATNFMVGPNPNKSVVAAKNSADIQVRDLTVDGFGRGNGNNRMYGIGYWNAGGRVVNCDVTGVRETPINGNQHGVAIGANNDDGGPYVLEIGGCNLDDFQKNGMALSGANLTVDVHDCSVVGAGDINFTAQNGIQVSFGASGVVNDCAISDMRYTPATAVASGLLVYQPGGPVDASGLNGPNAIANVQAPVSWYDGSGSIDGLEVTGTIVAGQDFGPVFVANFTSLLAAASPASRPTAVPMDGGAGDEIGAPGPSLTAPAAFDVTITSGCLTGSDVAGTVGVYAYSGGSPLSVEVTNSVVGDWDYGFVAEGASTELTVNENHVTSNVSAGYDNTLSLAAQDAELNWWGHLSGPSGAGPGSGDAINGLGVDVTPWLSNDADSDPGCAFAPAGDNPITAGPGGCLSTVTTCITVPVTIARTDAIGMRGFSVQVSLSPELDLCAGTSSIVQGTYLSSININTNFQVISLGGGVYTVDGVILGSPCGATAATGTLFTVAVKRTVPNGTGTITVTPLKARDCANAPLPVSPGAPLSIEIDTTPPVAITDLAAIQDKTLNDADGTTKVNITFNAPGDASTIKVYRAGFGNYPEYDDAPGAGSVPSIPSYPPPAPWTLTAVTASAMDDETTGRDFWYYVAFGLDDCGNVSAVSTMTGGTLNYHLGDTHNGVTNCAGNNLVNTSDISFLGGNYGIGLGVSSPLGCLDVGPTTDYSVDARPTTDNLIDFEDLIVFAINYGTVSKPVVVGRETVSGRNELALTMESSAEGAGIITAVLEAAGAGDIQGMSIDLAWNSQVVEPIEVDGGDWLNQQSRSVTLLSARPGNVDLALLGRGAGLSGNGTLARVTFRVKASGDPGIRIDQVVGRNVLNRPVAIATTGGIAGDLAANRPTRLGVGHPNPFQSSTQLPLSIGRPGVIRLTVFDVLGRPVRTLIDGSATAGEQIVTWDGLDQNGVRAASGLYFIRLEADGVVSTVNIHLVR